MTDKLPYIQTNHFTNFVSAYLACEIQPRVESNKTLASLNVIEQAEIYQRQIRVLLQRLARGTTLESINLRYIYNPAPGIEQKFMIACLLRSDGETQTEAEEKLLEGWHEYESIFPHQLYALLPANDLDSFNQFYLPIIPERAEVIEIRKREDVVPTRYVAAGEYFYSVLPVESDYFNLADALVAITNQPHPFVISVCLAPTVLTDEEEITLRQVVGQLHKFADGFEVMLYTGLTIFAPDPNAKTCLLRFASLLSSADSLYQIKVQIVSPRPIAPHITRTIASTFNQNFELEIPQNENLDFARKTYEYLHPFFVWGGHPIWETNDAPLSLRRISHLVSIDEAVNLFRLPVLFHEKKLYSLTYIYNNGRIDHVGDKKFTIRGDVNAPMQVAFDKVFGDMSQSLQASPIAQRTDVSQLHAMLHEMQAELSKASEANASEANAVADRIQKLLTDLQGEKLDKEDITYNGNKLLAAAEKLKDVMPRVLEISAMVVKFILKLAI